MSKYRFPFLLMLVVCLGALTHGVALYGPQVVDGPDVKIHYRWALQFAAALSEGVWYPRWASYSYFGLGDPTFLYIHPLFYYAVAATNLLLKDVWYSILAVGAGSTALTAAVTYWFSRKHAPPSLALAAAGAMALSPYSFHLAHYQQFLPMHFAMPSLVLFLGVVSLNHDRYRIPLTAMSLALLILSHVLAAFMALICTAAIIFWRAVSQRQGAVRLLLEHGAGVALGLALSAIYLLPALTTQSLVSPTGWFQPVYLDWRNSFLLQYFTLPTFGFRWFHLQWTIPLLTVLVSGLSAFFLWLGRASSESSNWQMAGEMLAVTILALMLGSELAYPIWEHMGILKRLQFPLRFLQVACAASIFSLVWSSSCVLPTKPRLVWVAMSLFLSGSCLMLSGLERQFATEAKPALAVAAPGPAQRGQPEMKPATAGDGWHKYLEQGGWKAECAALSVTCASNSTQTHRKVWMIGSTAVVQALRLPMFWFPGWEFTVNGELLKPAVDPDTGLPTIALTPGDTQVVAEWVGIPQERAGSIVSLLAVTIAFGLVVLGKYREKRSRG